MTTLSEIAKLGEELSDVAMTLREESDMEARLLLIDSLRTLAAEVVSSVDSLTYEEEDGSSCPHNADWDDCPDCRH